MINGSETTTIEHFQEQVILLTKQNADLVARLDKYAEELAEAHVLLEWYEEQFRLNQHKRFGASSERTDMEQLCLFNEVEDIASPMEPEPELETITYKRRKKQGKRGVFLEDLPVEVIEYKLDENERTCPCCQGPMHQMSTKERKELMVIPPQVKVINHVASIYSCRNCEREGISTPILTAPMPAPVLPKSLASPSAIAYIVTQKYDMSMPLYRQEKQFNRLGVDLPRQTMANWVLLSSEYWLDLLYKRMHEQLLKGDVIQCDETPLQVLREPGRAPQTQSYMWLYRSGRDGPPIVLYEYQPTRAGSHPAQFLSGFTGYIQVDGYAGYNKIPNVTLIGCWSHARRGFEEAIKALPKSARKSQNVTARKGLNFCNQLFDIERDLKELSPEERYEARLVQSRPVLDAFLAWLDTESTQVLPKSLLGKAITYCKNQWNKLTAFLKDGRLEIDNNRSERSIKPFVIGRKNWLFSNTPRGAKASAVCYSIVQTAKENNLKPFAYLTYVLERLPNIDINDPAAVDELLPWSPTLPEHCRVRSKN